jgi:hypothetical protein
LDRRKFMFLFGGSLAAICLPGGVSIHIPPTVPALLPPVKASSFRMLMAITAHGLSETHQRFGRIIVTRIVQQVPIINFTVPAYGGYLHHQLAFGHEIYEVAGHEVKIECDDEDIAWSGLWKNEDGSYDFTAGIGGVQTSTTHQPKIERIYNESTYDEDDES